METLINLLVLPVLLQEHFMYILMGNIIYINIYC